MYLFIFISANISYFDVGMAVYSGVYISWGK